MATQEQYDRLQAEREMQRLQFQYEADLAKLRGDISDLEGRYLSQRTDFLTQLPAVYLSSSQSDREARERAEQARQAEALQSISGAGGSFDQRATVDAASREQDIWGNLETLAGDEQRLLGQLNLADPDISLPQSVINMATKTSRDAAHQPWEDLQKQRWDQWLSGIDRASDIKNQAMLDFQDRINEQTARQKEFRYKVYGRERDDERIERQKEQRAGEAATVTGEGLLKPEAVKKPTSTAPLQDLGTPPSDAKPTAAGQTQSNILDQSIEIPTPTQKGQSNLLPTSNMVLQESNPLVEPYSYNY